MIKRRRLAWLGHIFRHEEILGGGCWRIRKRQTKTDIYTVTTQRYLELKAAGDDTIGENTSRDGHRWRGPQWRGH